MMFAFLPRFRPILAILFNDNAVNDEYYDEDDNDLFLLQGDPRKCVRQLYLLSGNMRRILQTQTAICEG